MAPGAEQENPVVRLTSPRYQADLLPEVGGKIAQIRDITSGRELLIGPQKPYRTLQHQDDWLQFDTSGMDDCFPNVAACTYPDEPWAGAPLPDLGEWTHGEWQLTSFTESEALLMRSGTILPYTASKSVRFAEDHVLELSYRVENCGRAPMRYLWSAHPLLVAEEAFELILPPGPLEITRFPRTEERGRWPHWSGLDLSDQWIAPGTTLKIFLTGLREGWCVLKFRDYSLHFSFDVNELPVLGLWFNHFGFPKHTGQPFRCIAVEPCTSPTDLLDLSAPALYPQIAPGAAAQWKIYLSIFSS